MHHWVACTLRPQLVARTLFSVSGPALPQRLQVALNDYATRLRAELGPRLRDLKLFGSWARGEAGPESDVDVWVLVDHFDRATRDAPFEAAQQTCLAHTVDLTPTVMDEQEWQLLVSRQRRIALDIQREGMSL